MFCQKLATNFKILSKSLLFHNSLANWQWNRLLNTKLLNDGRVIAVQESQPSGRVMEFPTIWLRDNCQCIECFHHETQSRKINWERCNNIGARAAKITTNFEMNGIIVYWQDAHKSEYNLQWLSQRDFCTAQQQHYKEAFYRPQEIVWGKIAFSNVLKFYDFPKIIECDKSTSGQVMEFLINCAFIQNPTGILATIRAQLSTKMATGYGKVYLIFLNSFSLYEWLKTLAVYGIAVIQNAPHDASVARQLANRIGFPKRTTYGELFDVKSKEGAGNYAYLMTPLPLHIDVPFYEYIPGINILHCLIQSESKGGANLLTDGFFVATQLRQHYKMYFEILSQVAVDWYDIGKDNDMEFHNVWREPIINLDIDGHLHRINHNTTKRDSHFTVPLETVDIWYEAYDKFLKISYETAVEFKAEPGDVLAFNNRRILHGRTAYEDTIDNKRHLIGAYVDWDIIYSKMRVLKKKLNL